MSGEKLNKTPGWVRKVNILLLTVLLALWVQQFSSLLMRITGRASYLVDAAVVLLLALLFMILIGGALRNRLTPVRFFTVAGILLGLVYLVLFPPWGAPDTVMHYLASYRVSNFLLLQGEAGAWMGRSEDVMVLNGLWPLRQASAPNPQSADYAALFNELYLLTSSGNSMPMPHADHLAVYSLFNYLPQAAGLVIGRLLGLGSVLTTELGRLMMLAVYVALCAWAVRIAPAGKSVFALVPLLPPCLMLGTSFSSDAVLIPVTMCLCAGILRLSLGSGHVRDLLFCVIMAFLLGALKGGVIFLLLIPLLFLLLTEARQKGRKKAGMLLLIMAAGFLSAALFDLVLTDGLLSRLKEGSGGTYTAAYALEQPLQYLSMAWRAYARSAARLVAELGGMTMGWMEKVNPKWLAYGLLLSALAACLLERDAARLRKRDLWLFLLVALFAVLLTPAMMLGSTPLTEKEIIGLQGRYYLPALPACLILVGKFHLYDLFHGLEENRDDWKAIGETGRIQLNKTTGEVRAVQEAEAEKANGEVNTAAQPKEEAGMTAAAQAFYQIFIALSVCAVWYMMQLYLTR